MAQEGRQPDRTAQSALPHWMAPILLLAAIPGMVVVLAALMVSFVGNGPYGDPNVPPPPDIPLVDRAMWWVTTGPGALSSVATLATLGAFAVVALSRRQGRPIPSRLLLAAFWATALFSLMELSGPITVAAGYLQLSRNPTAARVYWSRELFDLSSLVVCLVLAVLAGLLASSLWTGRGWVREELLPSDPPDAQPWLDEVTSDAQARDPDAMFRRPPERHRP